MNQKALSTLAHEFFFDKILTNFLKHPLSQRDQELHPPFQEYVQTRLLPFRPQFSTRFETASVRPFPRSSGLQLPGRPQPNV